MTRTPPVTLGGTARHLLATRLSRHPERYLEILRVLRTYDLLHIAARLGMARAHADDEESHVLDDRGEHAGDPAALASALEELGPCFIKLGQLLSTRPDLLPPTYIQALVRLQNGIAPVPSERVVRIVEGELGVPLDEVFRSFERTPLATASMAQVHRAVLHDGREVAVKVQRPGVRRRIAIDLAVLHEVARFATRHTPFGARHGLLPIVRELEHSLDQELDFRQEADNTALIARQIADFPRLTAPTTHAHLTTGRVLTLSFVDGRPLDRLSPAEVRALDGKAIARDLLSAYLKQIAIDGVFHCDPHPGNVLLAEDGRLALLDFGMVGRLDAGQKDTMILLLLAFSERQGQRVADTYLDLIEIPKALDRRAFTQDVSALVSRYHDMSGGRMALGTALLDLTKLAYRHKLPVPSALTLLGKTMLNLDGTIRVLSPELDPVQLIRDYMLHVMERRVMASVSPGRLFTWLLDMKHLHERGPRHADIILDKLANDQFRVRLEVDQLDEALRGLNRAAGRLSLGLIAGSLIIGGAHLAGALAKGDGRSGQGG